MFGYFGGGADQFYDPTSLAVDGSGNVYVADDGNNRIDEFSSHGVFTEAWGWGVRDGGSSLETCTSACRARLGAGGAGELSGPRGVTVDGSGNILVADSNNNRIDEFSPTGAFIEAWGWGVLDSSTDSLQTCTSICYAGLGGSGAGPLNEPWGVAVSGSNVYVGDNTNNRIDEFSTADVVSASASTISASPPSITANGSSTSAITVHAKDANGNDETTCGDTVTISATAGTISLVTDHHDGTYTATLTSTTTTGSPADISGTIGGIKITSGDAFVGFTPQPQTLVFTSSAPTSATVGGASYTPTATGGGSGNPVAFSIDPATTNSACSIDASVVVSFVHPGSCVIDANQADNSDYTAAAEAQQTFKVGQGSQATTATVLGSSGTPSSVSQSVSYTATVSPAPDGGNVSFSDGASTITGCDSQALTDGVATCTPATYHAVGSHSITANYSGDANHDTSSSTTFTQTVQATTATGLSSSANPSKVGDQVTYTATVSPVPDGGAVAFSDHGQTITGCERVALNTSTGAATCATTYSSPSSQTITAGYSGDSNYTQSASPPLSEAVTSTPNPISIGKTTATISGRTDLAISLPEPGAVTALPNGDQAKKWSARSASKQPAREPSQSMSRQAQLRPRS